MQWFKAATLESADRPCVPPALLWPFLASRGCLNGLSLCPTFGQNGCFEGPYWQLLEV